MHTHTGLLIENCPNSRRMGPTNGRRASCAPLSLHGAILFLGDHGLIISQEGDPDSVGACNRIYSTFYEFAFRHRRVVIS